MATITEVYKSKFLTRFYHEKHNILEGRWTDDGSMTDKDYREIMLGTVESTEKYKPLGILADTREFHLSIIPATQEWINQEVFPKAIAAGIKKVAFLVPQNIFVEVSLDQTMNEENAKDGFQTKFFNDHDKALSWLIEI